MYGDSVRSDLSFLVENPKKSLASVYHDAGSCWQLIEEAVKEIRRLRRKLGKNRGERRPKNR